MINTPANHKRMVCVFVCVCCSSIMCCVYTFCLSVVRGTSQSHVFLLTCHPVERLYVHTFMSWFFCVSRSRLCQHMYFTSLPFTAFCSGSSYDCPPSQSLRRRSRETRHAQSGCLYHVYLCSSRVSFLPSFHLLPSFIVCNLSSGLTG